MSPPHWRLKGPSPGPTVSLSASWSPLTSLVQSMSTAMPAGVSLHLDGVTELASITILRTITACYCIPYNVTELFGTRTAHGAVVV